METVYIGNTLINDIFVGSQRYDEAITRFIGTDPNVQNFVVATGISNADIINSLDLFVTTLKGNGIWNKLYALYPFVGGTQATNRVNLINTGSYNLGFTGSWAYSSNGVASNGTNTWANTSFFPSQSVSDYVSNSSLSVFVRTDTASGGYDMGAESVAFPYRTYFISKGGGNAAQYDIGLNQLITPSAVTGSGFWVATVSGSGSDNQRIFRNGTKLANKTNVLSSNQTPTSSLAIAANNLGNGVNAFTSESYSLVSIGKGFTDAEVPTYNTAVQVFQTSLGRNI